MGVECKYFVGKHCCSTVLFFFFSFVGARTQRILLERNMVVNWDRSWETGYCSS